MESVKTILRRMIKTGYLMRDKTLDIEFQNRIMIKTGEKKNEKTGKKER